MTKIYSTRSLVILAQRLSSIFSVSSDVSRQLTPFLRYAEFHFKGVPEFCRIFTVRKHIELSWDRHSYSRSHLKFSPTVCQDWIMDGYILRFFWFWCAAWALNHEVCGGFAKNSAFLPPSACRGPIFFALHWSWPVRCLDVHIDVDYMYRKLESAVQWTRLFLWLFVLLFHEPTHVIICLPD